MRKIFFFSLMLTAFYANADEKIVPLDMELGYWEIRSEMGESEMLKEMLASVPESQRAQVRAMMDSSMKLPIVKQCVTEALLKDMGKQIRESLSGQKECLFKVIKTTNKELEGEFNCSGNISTIHTKVISSKRHEGEVNSVVEGVGAHNMRMISEWKSATCPAGVE